MASQWERKTLWEWFWYKTEMEGGGEEEEEGVEVENRLTPWEDRTLRDPYEKVNLPRTSAPSEVVSDNFATAATKILK